MQDKLHYTKRSASCDERSVKCRVSRLERMKFLLERSLKTWSQEGKLLLFIW